MGCHVLGSFASHRSGAGTDRRYCEGQRPVRLDAQRQGFCQPGPGRGQSLGAKRKGLSFRRIALKCSRTVPACQASEVPERVCLEARQFRPVGSSQI